MIFELGLAEPRGRDSFVFRRASFFTAAAVGMAAAGLLAAPSSLAAAPTCNATPVTWTNATGDGKWETAANWSTNAVPVSLDPVVVNTGKVSLSSSQIACSLTVGAGVTVAVGANSTLTVSGVATISGGAAFAQRAELEGVVIARELDTSGYVRVGTVDGNDLEGPLSSVVGSAVQFSLAPASTLDLAGPSVVFESFGTATLGAGATIRSTLNPTNYTAGALKLAAATLGGDVAVEDTDVSLTSDGVIDTAGHRLDFQGASALGLLDGSELASSTGAGQVQVEGAGLLEADGIVTIDRSATLTLGPASEAQTPLIADSASFSSSGQSGIFAGPGSIDWIAGVFAGHVSFAKDLKVTLAAVAPHTAGVTSIGGKTVLLNKSKKLTLASGSLEVTDKDSTFENAATVTQTGGGVTSKAQHAAPVLNDAGATWNVALKHGKVAKWTNVSLTNKGLLDIAAGDELLTNKSFTQTKTGTTQLAVVAPAVGKDARIGAHTLTLAGKLKLKLAKSYKPKPGATLNGIVNGSERKGTFGSVLSTKPSAGTWVAVYKGGKVSAKLAAS